MNPNEAYRQLSRFFGTEGPFIVYYNEARELWQALDSWLRRGGFAPAAWHSTPTGGDDYADIVGLHWAADTLSDRGREILGEQVRYAAESIAEAAGVVIGR